MHLAATIERAEKQMLLARYGRRLLCLLDDTPLVPGETRAGYEQLDHGRQILDDAEQDLKSWEPRLEPVTMATGARSQAQEEEETNGEHEEAVSYQKEAAH